MVKLANLIMTLARRLVVIAEDRPDLPSPQLLLSLPFPLASAAAHVGERRLYAVQ